MTVVQSYLSLEPFSGSEDQKPRRLKVSSSPKSNCTCGVLFRVSNKFPFDSHGGYHFRQKAAQTGDKHVTLLSVHIFYMISKDLCKTNVNTVLVALVVGNCAELPCTMFNVRNN